MKYAELQERIKELERKLYMRECEIRDAHVMCDKLDVPKSKSRAFVGHRLYWYSEGKRESYKTSENTEGYSPEEWKRRKQALRDIESGKHIKPASKLNVLPDN